MRKCNVPTPGGFQVSLIPATLAATTLGAAGVGAVVNLEVDVLAKYVERLVSATPSRGRALPPTSLAPHPCRPHGVRFA